MRASSIFFALYLLSMPAYCLIRLSGQTQWIMACTAFTAISFFAFSLSHCIGTRGIKRAILMLLSGFAIALTFEYLGSSAGFLYGNYDYTDQLGPKAFGQVPIIIPTAWFMMLYPAWETAAFLLRQTSNVKGNHSRFIVHVLRAILAAFAVTAWDLSLDPRMVNDGNWIWRDGGAYFGIPLSNYVGWFVTAATIYAVWTISDCRLQIADSTGLPTIHDPKSAIRNQLPVWAPVWAYVVTWLGESLANALFWGGPAVAIGVFIGMGLFGAPALYYLVKPLSQGKAGVSHIRANA